MKLHLLVSVLIFVLVSSQKPVVLWHGMGDTCCFPFSMGRIGDLITNQTGSYVHSVMIGDNIEDDESNGFLMNINNQIDFACKQLKADPKLAGGFNAIGFSQGGQFLRAYVQRCNDPPVNNLITMGAQHQGVFGFPKCPGDYTICEMVRRLLDYGAYIGWIQSFLVQAEYWNDPLDQDNYLKYNVFLPDINNEKDKKNDQYKKNLLTLKNFVMVKFNQDSIVVPRESEWFGYYKPGQDQETQSLIEFPIYKEDWLGLKQLNETGRLHLLATDGDHLRFTDPWFIDNIINVFLKN